MSWSWMMTRMRMTMNHLRGLASLESLGLTLRCLLGLQMLCWLGLKTWWWRDQSRWLWRGQLRRWRGQSGWRYFCPSDQSLW